MSASTDVVYVHGISRHTAGYSDEWFESLEPHLTVGVTKHEVRWSDIVNPSSQTFGLAARPSEEERFVAELRAELGQREESEHPEGDNGEPEVPMGVYGGQGFGPDDFVRYMLIESTREEILATFDEVVVPLLSSGKVLSIIAHSWGTVVSYEGLARLNAAEFPGRVDNLFTLGSALSLKTVQKNLFQRVSGSIAPPLLTRIINVDAGGDLIGGSISPPFAISREYLRQKPTGCRTFKLSPGTARSPFCAHSSYFDPDNVEVQRDILACYINNSDGTAFST